MRIVVTSGTGAGRTPLSSFDSALLEAGIGNFNLIRLSSVIPLGAQLVTGVESVGSAASWGDRLYVVLAEDRQIEHGRRACAGLGWIQNIDTGQGLFVEHHGPSEESVRTQITDSLETMRESRGESFGPVEMSLASISCETQPVCALVAAVFQHEPW
jgi:arginine decarboxylase